LQSIPQCDALPGIRRFMIMAADMNRREQWQKVLDAEVRRWLAMPYEELISALHNKQVYEVEFESRTYQVEMEILENTPQYVHVLAAVDDGSLPRSLLPASHTFIRNKPASNIGLKG
jgi:hypothetical protein